MTNSKITATTKKTTATKPTTTATKQSKRDTVAGQVAMYANANIEVQPNTKLSPAELIHFRNISQAREASGIRRFDVSLMENLAKLMAQNDIATATLAKEGLTTVNQRGTTVVSALLNATVQLNSSIQSLTRTLGISTTQTQASTIDAKVRNAESNGIRELKNNPDDEGLLA